MAVLMNNIEFKKNNDKGFQVERNDPSLRDRIQDLLNRYYIHHERTENVFDELLLNRREDVVVADIDSRLTIPNCHDKDLQIFSAFNNFDDLIVDVGANWGYSVADMWAYGAKTKILSFEPVKFYAPLFERIKQLRPNRFEYRIVAIYDRPSTLTFSVPVINRLPVFALASATSNPDLNIMTNNMCYHIENYMRDDLTINIRMHEFQSPVDTLDSQLESMSASFSWKNIVAIKVDVEGLEFPVIRGAKNTLDKYRPLIMLEGGNRWPGLTEYMDSLGYIFAERDGDKLFFQREIGQQINGFFIHKSRIVEYINIGILERQTKL